MADRAQRPAWDPLSRVEAVAVDRAAAELLAAELGHVIVGHYHRRPQSRTTVYEILDALACLSAHVIKGAGDDAKQARAWFDVAFDNQLLGEEQGHG